MKNTKEKIQVGIQTDRVHHPPNGPKRYREELCRSFIGCGNIKKLVFFQFSSEHHPLFDENVRVEHISRTPGLAVPELNRMSLDVIHLDPGLHKFPLLPFLEPPVVTTIHGLEPLVLEGYSIPFRVRLQKKYIWPAFVRYVDKVIAVSNSLKRSIRTHYPVESEAIDVVYNGIDHDRYTAGGDFHVDQILTEYDIDKRYLLTVNSYSPRKNAETLIETFEQVAPETDRDLVIVGPGWDDEQVEARIDDSEVSERIVRLGKVDQRELPALYAGASVFISTTLHENFGFTIAEAMACGTPVVVSGVYAIPEVVGEAGILVDDPRDADAFSEAILDLLNDQEKRERLAAAGVEKVSEFTWERCARETLNVYESIADSG